MSNYRFFLKVPRAEAVGGFITFEAFPKVKSDCPNVSWTKRAKEAFYERKLGGLIFTGEHNPNSPNYTDFDAVKQSGLFEYVYIIVRSYHDDYESDFLTFAFKPNTGKYDDLLKTVEVNAETNSPMDIFLKYKYRDIDLYAYPSTIPVSLNAKQSLMVWTYSAADPDDLLAGGLLPRLSDSGTTSPPNIYIPYSKIVGKVYWRQPGMFNLAMVTYIMATDTSTIPQPPTYTYPGLTGIKHMGEEYTVKGSTVVYEGNSYADGAKFTPVMTDSDTCYGFYSLGDGVIFCKLDEWEYVGNLYPIPGYYTPLSTLRKNTSYRVFFDSIEYDGKVVLEGYEFTTNETVLNFTTSGSGALLPAQSPNIQPYIYAGGSMQPSTIYTVFGAEITYMGNHIAKGGSFSTDATHLSFTGSGWVGTTENSLIPVAKPYTYCRKRSDITFDSLHLVSSSLLTDPYMELIDTLDTNEGIKYIYCDGYARRSFDVVSTIDFSPARSLFDALDFSLKQQNWSGLRSKFFTENINYVTGTANRLNNLVFWQKTDVKNYLAKNKATRCNISMDKLLESLKSMFFMQYRLDGENFLELEHESYYDTQLTAVDLREAPSIERDQIYSYAENSYPLYEKYTFGEGSRNNQYVTRYDAMATDRDNSDSRSVDVITTDINDILSSPSSFSDEGIVMATIQQEESTKWIKNYGKLLMLENRTGVGAGWGVGRDDDRTLTIPAAGEIAEMTLRIKGNGHLRVRIDSDFSGSWSSVEWGTNAAGGNHPSGVFFMCPNDPSQYGYFNVTVPRPVGGGVNMVLHTAWWFDLLQGNAHLEISLFVRMVGEPVVIPNPVTINTICTDTVRDIVLNASAIPSYTGSVITLPPTGSVVDLDILNGYLFWPNLIRNFGLHGRYQPTFRGGDFNQTGYTATSLARMKKQDPVFCYMKDMHFDFDPETQGFITYMNEDAETEAAKIGRIESAELSLGTNVITITTTHTPE